MLLIPSQMKDIAPATKTIWNNTHIKISVLSHTPSALKVIVKVTNIMLRTMIDKIKRDFTFLPPFSHIAAIRYTSR
jgi:hypothetical protein